jgi:hypothetical protein
MTDTRKERRHFTRIAFNADAILIDTSGNRQWHTELVDISLKGALIKRPADWEVTPSGAFSLQLILDTNTVLRFDVRVVYMQKDRIGLYIEQLDLDSASHLQRLMELNLGDSDTLERELAELFNPRS